jgi:hypothetical protein
MEGSMEKKPIRPYLGLFVMLGAVWGLSETSLGL